MPLFSKKCHYKMQKKTLTENDILNKTKVHELKDVKNISFWGMELEDVNIIKKLTNVVSITLSANNIKSLEVFSFCKKLKELFLRKNQISSLNELYYLHNLDNLQTLWLSDNPITNEKDYREFTIAFLPQLKNLDEIPVTDEECTAAKSKFSDLENIVKENETQESVLRAISDLLPLLNKDSLNALLHDINRIQQKQ